MWSKEMELACCFCKRLIVSTWRGGVVVGDGSRAKRVLGRRYQYKGRNQSPCLRRLKATISHLAFHTPIAKPTSSSRFRHIWRLRHPLTVSFKSVRERYRSGIFSTYPLLRSGGQSKIDSLIVQPSAIVQEEQVPLELSPFNYIYFSTNGTSSSLHSKRPLT
jgi:hypothetical protein